MAGSYLLASLFFFALLHPFIISDWQYNLDFQFMFSSISVKSYGFLDFLSINVFKVAEMTASLVLVQFGQFQVLDHPINARKK